MKKILTLIFALVAFTSVAQITAPVVEEKPDTDSKYLAGAVPEVNDRVVLTRTIDLPASLSTADVMTRLNDWIERCKKDQRMHFTSRLPQTSETDIQEQFRMELTFSKSFIAHDFAEIIFVLELHKEGDKVIMDMHHITYQYIENSKNNRYTAEEMITDKNALNKRKTKMIYGYKKFRMKTIDLLDEFQISLQKEFNE